MLSALIRSATLDDIPALLAMGAKFAEKARLNEHVGYDPASMEATFRTMIDSPSFCLFIGASGAIGGIIAPHPFNHKQLIADELFWWSEGQEGGALLEHYEQWALSQGALVRMTALEAIAPKAIGKFYQKRGYKPLEHAYIEVN